MIQDWANENLGSIELTGNLAAVGQRHLLIQNQLSQIAALQSLAEAQRRQQVERALLEERQNILYDISGALEDIKRSFEREPAKAYFGFLVLEEFVSSLRLEHRLFPGLEWKNHCDKTLAGISELHSWCETSLDAKSKQIGADALAQQKKRREDEEVRKRNEKQDAQRLAMTQAITKQARASAVAGLCCLVVGLATLLIGIAYSVTHPTSEEGDSAGVFMVMLFGGSVLFAGMALWYYRIDPKTVSAKPLKSNSQETRE